MGPGAVANQSILISGESGAGKTVTTKFAMKYLATVGAASRTGGAAAGESKGENKGEEGGPEDKSVEEQVLESNPILEALGNARTVRNDNSSRFGKFIEMKFSNKGRLIGAGIQSYLLEKVRLVIQAEGERNYHVFYQMCAGASEVERARWQIGDSLEAFNYTNQSGCYDRRDGVLDSDEFVLTKKAMHIMGFGEDEQVQIFDAVASVLHAGNLTFTTKEGVPAEEEEAAWLDRTDAAGMASAEAVAALLQTTGGVEAMETALTSRMVTAGGETYMVRLTVPQASDARDALFKSVYSKLFDWIVRRINKTISRAEGAHFIGVLDIFGFEVFTHNSLEQLCINYANETLQQQFNLFIFKLEQEEYEREGIAWSFVDFPDNAETLKLIEG